MKSLNMTTEQYHEARLERQFQDFNRPRKNKLTRAEWIQIMEIDLVKEFAKPYNRIAQYKQKAISPRMRFAV